MLSTADAIAASGSSGDRAPIGEADTLALLTPLDPDDRYRLGRRIGRGGVGEVYQGWQVALDRPVAIKLLRPELTANTAAVARFEREARTTSLLSHPHVVTVIDIGRTRSGTHFVVMELLEGETLADTLDREERLPAERALDVARQIALGMGAGQGVGLVHRDLKPENLFLVDGQHIKVLDFGLATLREPDPSQVDLGAEAPSDFASQSVPDPGPVPVDETIDQPLVPRRPNTDEPLARARRISSDRLTRPGALMGTPRYMAPEQVLGWAVDQRTDLYAFGCILYEMLSGRPPFLGPGPRDFLRQHLHEPPPRLDTLPGVQLPEPLVCTVHRLLEKSPAERFQDWSSLSEALRELTAQADVEPGRAVPTLQADPLPVEPYRFLTPFTAATRQIFFGRDTDTQRFRTVWEHPDRPAIVLLTGASGVGKTSFLSARVVPALKDTGHRVLRVRGTRKPLDQLERTIRRELTDLTPSLSSGLSNAGTLPELLDALVRHERRPITVVIDQLEEIFTQGDAAAAQALQAGLASVLAGGDRRVRFLLALREDYLGATLRSLHPLPVDQISRTLPLRPLDTGDIKAALEGPGRVGLPVRYAPFSYEDGLADVIVGDLQSDSAGEVAPRIQAVGARLWEMARQRPEPHVITHDDYRQRLGRAQGILARILDEAVAGLDAADQGVAKEMLRAMTHLPGSPTSRPVPEDELVAHTKDPARRQAVLRQLEDRWRVIHGFQDGQTGLRAYRIAHESLIARIQQYGEEGTERNRARQVLHQGFNLWLTGGRREADLLPEQHFDEVQRHIDDLVLRHEDEQQFYRASAARYDEYYLKQHARNRRRAFITRLQVWGLPTLVLGVGVVLGQALTGFAALDRLRAMGLSWLQTPRADFTEANLLGANLSGAWLQGAVLTGADLRDVQLDGAQLPQARLDDVQINGAHLDGADLRLATISAERFWGTSFRQADLRGATVAGDLRGADFTGAQFDQNTVWSDRPPPCAVGVGGWLEGCQIPELTARSTNLDTLRARGADLQGADFSGSTLNSADFTGATLKGVRFDQAELQTATLRGADLTGASFVGAVMRKADLAETDLTGADLTGADLTGAVLDGAVLCGTTIDLDQSRLVSRRDTEGCDSADDTPKTP